MENTEATKRFSNDISFLLLDSDATRLANLSEMIHKCGYKVVATTRADDMPLIINNKDTKIDLVLAEFSLIEMNKYELLEKINLICETPIVVFGAYVEDAIVECMCRGAKYCLQKTLIKEDLENLWQLISRSTVRIQQDHLSQIDISPPEKNYSVTHSLFLGDELMKNNKSNDVKTEDLDKYKGENLESGDQNKPKLICPEMQNEFRETDDELSQGKKRKEIADTDSEELTEKDCGADFGHQKKPKLICADDLQSKTLDTVLIIEEVNNERMEPTEVKKNGEGSEIKKPELVRMEELEKWFTQPVINFGAYEFQVQDFQPLESVGKSVGPHEIPWSPQESSNKNVAAQPQVQAHGAFDEELMQDGMSLSDLEFDLKDGMSLSDLEFNLQDGISLSDLEFDLQDGMSLSDLEYDLQDGISLSDIEYDLPSLTSNMICRMESASLTLNMICRRDMVQIRSLNLKL